MHKLMAKVELMNSLSPDAYGIANLSVKQIIDFLAKKTYNSREIWEALHSSSAFGVDFFMTEILRAYRGSLIDD